MRKKYTWCDVGWSCDEWNDDWSSVDGMNGWEQTCGNSASSFSLRSFDLGAVNSPKRMGEEEPGHGSGSEHISIELCSRWSKKWWIPSSSQWRVYS